ncbi:MAG: hypothetical protein ACKVOI_16910 [Dongiaceae bacterium]
MRVNGITFSDELGGFEITGVSGSGTQADPFVVHENITSVSTDVVLVIKDIDPSIGNLVGTHHAFAFVLTKVVTNKTPQAWTRFALELREVLATYSPYGDGLSFGQASTAGRPYASPQFLTSNETEEPYDQLEFTGGRIQPGASVAMTFVISDASPEAILYLLQQPGQVVAQTPTTQPASGGWRAAGAVFHLGN